MPPHDGPALLCAVLASTEFLSDRDRALGHSGRLCYPMFLVTGSGSTEPAERSCSPDLNPSVFERPILIVFRRRPKSDAKIWGAGPYNSSTSEQCFCIS